MRRSASRVIAAALVAVAFVGAALAESAAEVREMLGIGSKDVLSGSVLTARVLPGDAKQVVAVTTYFTGKRGEADAVNVRLDVFRREGERLVSLYARDLGAENGGYVGRGEVELVDLDGDQVNEIVITYDDARSPVVSRRAAEVIVHEPSGFRVAWSGETEYDATRAARDVPSERRDRFVRTLDVASTLKTRGVTLFFRKRVIAVAGERLPEPKEVVETFPLRTAPEF